MKKSIRKKSAGKSRAAIKPKIRREIPAQKNKRKKPAAADRMAAVLVAAVLICAAAFSALALLYFHSAKAGNETAAAKTAADKAGGEKQEQIHVQAGVPAAETEPETKPPPAPPAVPVEEKALEKRASNNAIKRNPESKMPAKKTVSASLPVPGGIVERPPVQAPIQAPIQSRGTLAFVIDDVGNNLRDLEPFLKYPGPLTIAVLPGLLHSAEAARRIRAAGKEVFLHQPMEALGGQNPGPGAIRSGMDRNEIRAVISRNLEEIGPVTGINNHEGSRITMDEEAMEAVLSLCREQGILFLDSRTTAETAAPKAARLLGMTIGERDIFLDNTQSRESINSYINTGLDKAEQNGSAIMIGHVWSRELAPLLAELYPGLKEQGFAFSPVSRLINGNGL